MERVKIVIDKSKKVTVYFKGFNVVLDKPCTFKVYVKKRQINHLFNITPGFFKKLIDVIKYKFRSKRKVPNARKR